MNNTQCATDPNRSADVDLASPRRIFLVSAYPDLSLLHMERKFNHSEAEGGNACAGNYPHETHGLAHTVAGLVHTGESFRFGNYYRGIGITVDYGYYELSGKYKKVGRG